MTFKGLLSPGWSLCIYSCSSLHRRLLPKRALILSGRGKWNWEPDLPVHCERTMVIKGFPGCSVWETVWESWALLERGDALAGAEECCPCLLCCCFSLELVSAPRNPMSCSSLTHRRWKPCQRSQPGVDLIHICHAVALVLQRNLESLASMRADNGEEPSSLLLSLCTQVFPCIEMDDALYSPQPSDSVSLAVTMPLWLAHRLDRFS